MELDVEKIELVAYMFMGSSAGEGVLHTPDPLLITSRLRMVVVVGLPDHSLRLGTFGPPVSMCGWSVTLEWVVFRMSNSPGETNLLRFHNAKSKILEKRSKFHV